MWSLKKPKTKKQTENIFVKWTITSFYTKVTCLQCFPSKELKQRKKKQASHKKPQPSNPNGIYVESINDRRI